MLKPSILSSIPEKRSKLIERIFAKQNNQGLWKIAEPTLPLQLYLPKHTATYHTLTILADLGCDPNDPRVEQPLQTLIHLMYNPDKGVFGISPDAYSNHEPSPCINGHILYILGYFGKGDIPEVISTVRHFTKYQRFDDGDFKFILLHKVCYSSHHPEQLIHKHIDELQFPGLSFLEILHSLKRAGVRDRRMERVIQLLNSKRNPDGSWNLERPLSNSIVPFAKKGCPNEIVTERALEVLDAYNS